MSKRSNACEFSRKVRERIWERDDYKCIFCAKFGYSGFLPSQIMHYVSRAHGGLGIEENGAFGCVLHHQILDNGDGKLLKEYFREYLMSKYPGWNEENLIYKKGG